MTSKKTSPTPHRAHPAPPALPGGMAKHHAPLSPERSPSPRHRTDDAHAFVGAFRSHDDLAEELAEEAVFAMTSGQDDRADRNDEPTIEDRGGPFVPTTAGEEFAEDEDESNPADATREPFPRT